MKKNSLFKTMAMGVALLMAESVVSMAADADGRLPAFPGAEGYGKWATGGRGGKTYVVTSLNDCAENDLKQGTLRWAVKQPGKKIVTFAVSGTIYLTSPLCFDSGDLTILGQTAPGDGICLADYPVTISCENAIIRYMRFRLGNRQVANHEGDGFGFNEANNVIMDHCSVSWSIDECLSISAATNLTIQWCMVEQALNDAGHSKGAHGYGGNWGGTNVSFHHNLIAQCTSRVPRLGGDTDPTTNDRCDLRNNVFYNWGGNGCYGAEAIDVNFVNNYYKPGPCTDQRAANIRKRICAPNIRTNSYIKTYPAFAHDLHKWGHFFADGNVNPDFADVTADNWTIGIENQVDASGQDGTWTSVTKDTIHLREPAEFACITTHTAEQAYNMVIDYAGASFRRDCVDEMIAAQVLERWGKYKSGSKSALYGQIDAQTDNVWNGQLQESDVENGAWPILNTTAPAKPDTDGDGVPDVYETTWGTDESDPTDGAGVVTSGIYKGYAYVEAYVNGIYKDLRDWNAHCLEDGELMGAEEPTIVFERSKAWEHEISALTFKGYDTKKRVRLFADDITMSGTGGISGGTGRDRTLKLSDQKYTINVPATIKAKAVRIYGYSNYTGNDIYIAELNGKTYGTTDYVISAEADTRTDITIPLEEEVSGKALTITFKGNKPTIRIYLVEAEPEPEPIIIGDVNGDGAVNVGDIMAVINVMAGQGQDIDKKLADVNNDGAVNVGDIMAIINIMATNN